MSVGICTYMYMYVCLSVCENLFPTVRHLYGECLVFPFPAFDFGHKDNNNSNHNTFTVSEMNQ